MQSVTGVENMLEPPPAGYASHLTTLTPEAIPLKSLLLVSSFHYILRSLELIIPHRFFRSFLF